MQNLSLTSTRIESLPWWLSNSRANPASPVALPDRLLAESQLDSDLLYLADGCAQKVFQFRQSTGQCLAELPLDAVGVSTEDCRQLVGLACIPETDEWVCLCTGRAICQISFDAEFVEEPKLTIVGEFDEPILAVSWSPGCEMVVFVKSDYKMVLMDSRFEPAWEADLMQEGFGKEAFIDVGWGRKETQFHGTAGKVAALRPNESCPPAAPWDAGRVRVSWRGDAEAVCTSCVSTVTGARQLRVWSPQDGSLLSTSEAACGGLEWALDWRPSGNLLAASRRRPLPDGLQVQLFERNGLCHGEFSVRADTDSTDIERLQWNSSSEILLVELIDRANPTACKTVQLWSSCNYHWYLRWSNAYPRDTVVEWSTGHFCLNVLQNAQGQCGRLTRLRFHWEVSRCRDQLESCNTLVPVIDGCRLQVTPLCIALVPPPMSAFFADFKAAKMQVLWARPLPDRPNWVALMLSSGRVHLLCPSSSDSEAEPAERHWQPAADATVVADQCGGFGFSASVEEYKCLDTGLTLDNPEVSHLEPLRGLRLAQYNAAIRAVRLFSFAKPSSEAVVTVPLGEVLNRSETIVTVNAKCSIVYCQSDSGRILWIDISDIDGADPSMPAVSVQLHSLPEPCPLTDVAEFGRCRALICLSESFNLYCARLDRPDDDGPADEVVARVTGVTSFCLHSSFLLVTSISHRLISLRLGGESSWSTPGEAFRCLGEDLTVASQQQQQQQQSGEAGKPSAHYSDRVRRIERGARLVACAAHDTQTVLQMPRGNLEGVHPRSLVLLRVSALLDRSDYGPAFELMRRHRINLNLLVDHNPSVFMQSIDRFIDSVASEEFINVFIAELDNSNVTAGMYSRAYSNKPPSPSIGDDASACGDNKVAAVCSALIDRLAARASFLTCRLSAWAKLGRLDRALRLLSDAATAAAATGEEGRVLDSGFRHLLYLSDVHNLYNCALGTYDLDLALLVAQRTHKDPKDYIGLLQSLASMPDLERRGAIDLQLMRYQSAVSHLAACGNPEKFEAAFRLARERQLFATMCLSIGRQGCSGQSGEDYKRVSSAWAADLRSKSQLEYSGLISYQAGLFRDAADAFKAALCPEMWLSARLRAGATAPGEEEVGSLVKEAGRIAARLSDTGRHAEAVSLLECLPTHFAPLEGSLTADSQIFKATLDGCFWQRCELLISKSTIAAPGSERAAELRAALTAAAVQTCDREVAECASEAAQLAECRARLLKLRADREARGAVFAGGGSGDLRAGPMADNEDAFSDAASTVASSTGGWSSASAATSSSSTKKSQRKARRKLLTAKPGHPAEELGLLARLRDRLAQRAAGSTQSAARRLHAALTAAGRFEEAGRLRRAQADAVLAAFTGVGTVWPGDIGVGGGPESRTTLIRTAQDFGCLLDCMCRPEETLELLEAAKAAWGRLDWGIAG